jgi:hypothetical protein
MDCIEITNVSGMVFPPATAPSSIRIQGTVVEAVGCTTLQVTIYCGDSVVGLPRLATVAGPNWFVEFPDISSMLGKCVCNGMITIKAVCLDNPECQGNLQAQIQCVVVCPTLSIIVSDYDESLCGSSPTAIAVTLHAVVLPGALPGKYDWDFGDGVTLSGSPKAFQTHTYTLPPPPMGYTVSVIYTPDPTSAPSCPASGPKSLLLTLCPPAPTKPPPVTTAPPVTTSPPPTASTPPTSPPPPPTTAAPPLTTTPSDDTDDDGDAGCFLLRLMAVITAILFGIAGAIALCIPGAWGAIWWLIVGLGVASIGLGLAWTLSKCKKPCHSALLLAWQFSIGVGIGILCFTACCPTFGWLGWVMVGAGGTASLTWVALCKYSYCRWLKEMQALVGGAILPVLGMLKAVPLLSGCVDPWAAGAASALGAAIVVLYAACSSSSPK